MITSLLGDAEFGSKFQDSLFSVAPLLHKLEDEIKEQTCSAVATVEDIGHMTLFAGGKRIRPALAILSAFSISESAPQDRLIKVGAALELVHMATLIHDDVIDESSTRRGQPTAAFKHGNTAAILSGDVLLARAMRILAIDGDLEVIRKVSSSVVELAEGEVMELEARNILDLDLDRHFEILDKKTASLILCATSVGCSVAGGAQEHRLALESYGRNIGLAFQLMDDWLDLRGQKAKTGKPVATDFREGQATWPIIDFMSHCSPIQREYVEARFGKTCSDSEIEQIIGWIDDAGSFDRTVSQAKKHAQIACDQLSCLPNQPFAELLVKFAAFVVGRES